MALQEMYVCSFCGKKHKVTKRVDLAKSIKCTVCSHRMDLIEEQVVETKESNSIKETTKTITEQDRKELRRKKTEELARQKAAEEARIAEEAAKNAESAAPFATSLVEDTIIINQVNK